MERILKKTWFDRSPGPAGRHMAVFFTLLLSIGGVLSILNLWGSKSWIIASGSNVFNEREYWRLWTSLLAHSDFGHISANAILFVPLVYLLAGYFGPFVPVFGFLFGAVINVLVLHSLPPQVYLLGISGVVSWLGAAWLTLFALVHRRERLKRRFAAALFLTLFLFVPETLRPNVSYYSHFLGYLGGAAFGLVYFFLHRRKFRAAEVWEEIDADPLIECSDWQGPESGS